MTDHTIIMGNDPEMVPEVLDELVKPLEPKIDSNAIQAIKLSLGEIIINAIEHGNLSINYEMKTVIPGDGLEALIKERKQEKLYASRKVTVTSRINDKKATFTVTDDGEGFNWRNFPNPTEENNMLLSHGRGLFIVHYYMDEVSFNEKGNRVTLVKYFKNSKEV